MGFNFEDLDVYSKAIDLVAGVYSVTKDFPKDEMFGLTSQLRRAAVAIPSNISEGSARTKKDFCRFINMARGSLFECVTLLRISRKQSYIDQKQFVDLSKELTDLSKMLSGLKRSISPQTMNNEHPTTNAFTLVELMVAVGILAIVLSFAGVIFNASIDTHRIALANAEIMQKLRAITGQLDADFQGLCRDAPLMIFFRQDPNEPNQRYDQIMFFADGDFQSTQLYGGIPLVPAASGMPIRGNIARIYYGQALSRDPNDDMMKYPFYLNGRARLLARRRHILSAYPGLYVWPDAGDVAGTFDDVNGAPAGYNNNEIFEHDSLSLAQWKILDSRAYGVLGGTILDTCFGALPWIDMRDPATFHKLMCEGVGSFTIQWAYWDFAELRWFPSDDPDGTGAGAYSHFAHAKADGFPSTPTPKPAYTDFDVFGALFNIPGATRMNYWGIASLMRYNSRFTFLTGFYPAALKFTFTLFDSKGIIKQGRTFTHIVYLDK